LIAVQGLGSQPHRPTAGSRRSDSAIEKMLNSQDQADGPSGVRLDNYTDFFLAYATIEGSCFAQNL